MPGSALRVGGGYVNVSVPKPLYEWDFAKTEDPVSHGGRWVANACGSRTRVVTTGSLAYGTQAGGGTYDDSYAELKYDSNGREFGPDTRIISTIRKASPSGIQEVEHLHRVTSSSNFATCYEPHLAHNGAYFNIVKWLGPNTGIGDFEYVVPDGTYSAAGVADGWRMMTLCYGQTTVTIEGWLDKLDGNGFVQVFSVQDTGANTPVLRSGRPGIGFYRETASGAANQYGLTKFRVESL